MASTSCYLQHIFLLVLCIAVLVPLVPGQGPAPAPVDCSSGLLPLLPCLDFVQGNASTPPKNCCDGLSSVVASTPSCLCTLFSPTNPYGFSVNLTDALMLPTLCKVTTPPTSECAAVGIPIASPTTMMSPSTSPTSPVPSSSSPTSSKPPASSKTPVPPASSPNASAAVGLPISAAICFFSLLLGTWHIFTLDLMQ